MDILYISVLIFAALLQVALLTLIVLLLYRFLINKNILKKQIVAVFIALTILNGSIGLSGYLGNDGPLTTAYFIGYCLAVGLVGMFTAYVTRPPEVGKS
jgi:uncharacterized BrkB/YihY/UPF0761 family membrane protein